MMLLSRKRDTPKNKSISYGTIRVKKTKYALSAVLWLSTYDNGHSKSSSYSEANFRTDWTWTTAPIFKMTDILAAAWSEGMYLQSSMSYAAANYHVQNTDTYHHSSALTVELNLNTGASVKVFVLSSQYPGTYAKTGQFGYRISKISQVNELESKFNMLIASFR